MIDLMQAGHLQQCSTFPHEIDPERLRLALRHVRDPASTANALRRLQIFEESGEAPQLREVLAEFAALKAHGHVRTPPARRGFIARLAQRLDG